jgi:hypothetical protein
MNMKIPSGTGTTGTPGTPGTTGAGADDLSPEDQKVAGGVMMAGFEQGKQYVDKGQDALQQNVQTNQAQAFELAGKGDKGAAIVAGTSDESKKPDLVAGGLSGGESGSGDATRDANAEVSS